MIGSAPKPDNIWFQSIPNVIPSEKITDANFKLFYEAAMTKMEAPLEELLDQIEPPVTAIIAEIGVCNRRNIPAASFWTMSASFFSMLYRFGLYALNPDSQIDLLALEDNIPGIYLTEIAELRTIIDREGPRAMHLAIDCVSRVPNAQYLLFTSVHELESEAMNMLRKTIPFPVNAIGPEIPYTDLANTTSSPPRNDVDHITWLDSQQEKSVLYVSLGSFLSVSTAQFDEMLAGLQNSGVKFLWVARKEATRLKETCADGDNDDKGLIVSWCDQLRVLCHPCVGGFWTHCGWNSTLEAVYAGVPMLTFPSFLDQDTNSRQIVEEWRIGNWVSMETGAARKLVSREEIAEGVKKLMGSEKDDRNEMRRRASELANVCQQSIAKDGSSISNIDAFIRDILESP